MSLWLSGANSRRRRPRHDRRGDRRQQHAFMRAMTESAERAWMTMGASLPKGRDASPAPAAKGSAKPASAKPQARRSNALTRCPPRSAAVTSRRRPEAALSHCRCRRSRTPCRRRPRPAEARTKSVRAPSISFTKETARRPDHNPRALWSRKSVICTLRARFLSTRVVTMPAVPFDDMTWSPKFRNMSVLPSRQEIIRMPVDVLPSGPVRGSLASMAT